jgi:guanosine-3',5'-bis(diphosphate) 3'-pyrophosphohydrolase
MVDKELRWREMGEFQFLPEEFATHHSERIKHALKVANEIHKDDTRRTNGEPYIYHCVTVASILESWGADEDEIIAGLLHDTVEDHPDLISVEDIEEMFGQRVAILVDGVTKLKTEDGNRNDFETVRKVTRESLIEHGVALIKLADRFHNMETMEGMPADVQKKKAEETLAVYAPLAESFGLWQVKNALEDLSFKYVDPQRYKAVKEKIDADPRLREKFILERKKEIEQEMQRVGIKVVVEYQLGGYWQIAEKQKRSAMRGDSRPKSFSEITDVISFRVLMKEEVDLSSCYSAMGAMRLRYASRLEKVRHDDYLATPADNGYLAIHDTYKFAEGNVEIAFTTVQREKFNNWGVVSLSPDELKNNPDKYKRKRVFTPKKEVVFMEPEARGVDIAYKLNPLLGLRAIGLKIDGKVFGLEEVVPNASLVEVIVDQHQTRPNPQWLSFCNSATRRLIEQQQTVAEYDEEVERGKKILMETVLAERGVLDLVDLNPEVVDKVLVGLGCWFGPADLYYKMAFGFDPELVSKKMDELGIIRGMFTTIQITGDNEIGVSKEVAGIVAKHGADTRSKVERVDIHNRFVIRILMTVGYQGKKKMEEELRRKYRECIVV